MRNIFLLISACIILALWVSDFFISIEDGNNSKEATPFNISVEDTGESRFNISQLAKVLGVDYKRIEDKNVGESPSIQEVKISLVAIYISGDKIKVRLRIINGNDEKLLDLMPGDIFQSLTLKNPAFMLPPSESWGYGGSIGLIYKMLPNLQFGLSYTTEIHVPEHKFNGTSLMPQTGGEGVYELEMNNPAIAAFGVAYKPVQKFLIEADFKWIGLSSVMYSADLKCPSGYIIPVTFGWDDVLIYALGSEYRINNGFKILGGWTYAATPITPENVDSNIGSIAVVEHHFSLAVNKTLTKTLAATLSYTYGLWNEVESSTSPLTIAAGFQMFFFELSYKL